ncbi:hypothetical protein C1645_866876 [Glomus cerebriforme]|uniref:MIR domain-containing protein n=1 Tax=Glomus cerebriforme TaxID=658196 RepID=A0A397SDE7_9GLOM|nr:hypothetical protein C1645_866876 [Glomus cerebriforme]
MELQKYDGNIHPDEWINDLHTYFDIKHESHGPLDLSIVKSLIDFTISLPTGIDDIEKLSKALKENISFTVFKNTNRRKLQSLKYIPESNGGDTAEFISNFRKLCSNAEINDVKEQKKYLYGACLTNYFDYVSNEFYKEMKNVNSTDELIKKFEDIVLEESNLIKNGSIVALKHVTSGKYLGSIKNLCYTTGSFTQMVRIFVESPEPDTNSLWRINLDEELASYTDTNLSLQLQHCKSNKFLGIINEDYRYYDSPITKHTEVSCDSIGHYFESYWGFSHSKLENHHGYLKSGDTINLSIIKDNCDEFLHNHDVQFTIGNDTFQEVFCHKERLGGNDEWCIELIKHA